MIINSNNDVDWNYIDDSATNIGNDLTITSGTFQPKDTSKILDVNGDVLVNGGTLSDNSTSENWAFGSLTQSSGTISQTSGTIYITSEDSGYAIDLDGTYTNNSGTVEIKTSGNTEADLMGSSGGIYDLTINSGGNVDWRGNTEIGNDLTVSGGTFRPNTDSDTLDVQDNVTINGGTLGGNTASGDWAFKSLYQTSGTIDATTGTLFAVGEDSSGFAIDLKGGTFTHNSGTIEINTGAHTDIDLTPASGTVYNIILDLGNTGYDATLQEACTISGQLDIDDGEIDTDNNAVTVTGELLIQNGGEFDAADDTADHTFGALDLDASGTYTAASGSDITITSESSGYAIDNDGTFTNDSGSVTITTIGNTEADLMGTSGGIYDLTINSGGNVDWRGNTEIGNDLTVSGGTFRPNTGSDTLNAVSYTHLRAHET